MPCQVGVAYFGCKKATGVGKGPSLAGQTTILLGLDGPARFILQLSEHGGHLANRPR